jgi:hypothetical protein
MALDSVFRPLLDAVKYVIYEPGGIFMLTAVTAENGGAERLTIAPPTSMKAYMAASNKSELLNLGLIGNTYLKKKISPDAIKWLKGQGWQDPQEPFNPHYSMVNRGDLALDDLLELALESWVKAYGVTPNTPFGMHLSLEQQNHIAQHFLTLDTTTYAFTIPGFTPNIQLEPAIPRKKRSSSKKTEAKPAQPKQNKGSTSKPTATKPEKAPAKAAKSSSVARGFEVGDKAILKFKAQGKIVEVTGTILGFEGTNVRLNVKGSPYIKDNVYVVPPEKLIPVK